MRGTVAVADVGGTNLRVAVFREGTLERVKFFPSIAPLEPLEGIGRMKEMILETTDGPVEAVVVGFPGLIDREGRLYHSPNMRAYEGVNLREALDSLGVPVLVENDANLYALGEGYRGSARGMRDFCCLTLGTGVGSGVVVNGKLVKGHLGFASEMGHMSVDLNGAPCGCGSMGCLEAYCSGTALVRMAKEKGLEVRTAKDLYDLAQGGSAAALEVFAEMGRYLGVGLANIANIFNPEGIILGGKVAEAFPFFVGEAMEAMARHAFPAMARSVKVMKASLGDEAALWGGLVLLDSGHEVL